MFHSLAPISSLSRASVAPRPLVPSHTIACNRTHIYTPRVPSHGEVGTKPPLRSASTAYLMPRELGLEPVTWSFEREGCLWDREVSSRRFVQRATEKNAQQEFTAPRWTSGTGTGATGTKAGTGIGIGIRAGIDIGIEVRDSDSDRKWERGEERGDPEIGDTWIERIEGGSGSRISCSKFQPCPRPM